MKIQKKQEIEFFGTKTGNANSIALGYATETKNFGEVAVGVMNKSTAAKDPNSPKGVCADSDATLFSVGCGGSGERKNALEVKGDGSVLISGENGDINVADKIKQALDTNTSIELVKSTESDLQYTLMVNNESRGSINIPKDQFLKNVTYDTDAKQLVFTFVTLDEEEHVERISINDLKDVYTAGNGINIDNNVISADFSSVMTAISDEKTQRETTDNEIKSTLDTKADKTSLEKQVEYLKGRSFYLGNEGQVASPFKAKMIMFASKIQEPKNNGEYAYVDMLQELYNSDGIHQFIYDKSLDKTIKITAISESVDIDDEGDFFRTAEPLDLSHTFYLDNEKTGDTENLDEMTIEESNVFKNLPYIDTNDTLNDDKAPQYIYDATDRKWIEVIETWYTTSYYLFNTEEPLDLTHEFGHCLYPTLYGNYASAIGEGSIALGHNASASGYETIALGEDTKASEVNAIALGHGANAVGIGSVALGYVADTSVYSVAIGAAAKADGQYSTALGCYAAAKGSNSVALGYGASTSKTYSIALGYTAKATDESSIALGFAANATSPAAIALGLDSTSSSNSSIALGAHAKAYKLDSIALGTSASANGRGSIALGCNTAASADDTIVIGKNNYSSKSACYSLSSNGKPLMEIERNNNGLYLQGFGGYDGTNLVVEDNGTETLNPNIKSVQQIINEKADTSAIPTKVSQLTNDTNFITSYTETDPVFTREKTNYYTKTEIDNKGYLTAHQSLDDYAKKTEIPNITTKADLVDGKLKAEQLPKLNNITAATTTEDIITKFNDLLADLKAKGYMTADITA